MLKMIGNERTEELKASLAKLLRERRVASGFTQGKVAAYCGCSRVTYAALETKGEGSVETLLKALYALDVAKPVFSSIVALGCSPGRRRVRGKREEKGGEGDSQW